MSKLHCRVERGPVLVRIGDATLPAATVQPELPGIEYVHVFDLVHAAVLRWSPNVVAAVPERLQGLSGAAPDCPVEDAIDALTYALVVNRSDLSSETGIEPAVLASVLALAAQATDVPASAEAWTECLRQSLEVHDAVSKRGVWQFEVDLEGGRVQVPS